ncbi:MAG: hypothetical protein J6W04_02075 [Bacteroidales bacterium]|nr:hypothetical protein [Bacteroidales bacterium]
MTELDKASKILEEANREFIIMQKRTGDEGGGITMVYGCGYDMLYATFAAIADEIMTRYVPDMGYTVHEDLKTVLKNTILLNKAEPNEELREKVEKKLKEIYSEIKVPDEYKDDPQGFFDSLRN